MSCGDSNKNKNKSRIKRTPIIFITIIGSHHLYYDITQYYNLPIDSHFTFTSFLVHIIMLFSITYLKS